MSACRRRDGQDGFTLIEMLISISIIALLLPAIKKSKHKARYIVCANQLRQVVVALQQYALEQNEYFPYGLWASPTIIGEGRDIIEKIQGSRMIDTDLRDGSGDPALSILTCPNWKKAGPYDGVHWNGPPYWGWWGTVTWARAWAPCTPRTFISAALDTIWHRTHHPRTGTAGGTAG